MVDIILPVKFVISLLLGAALGLERESHEVEEKGTSATALGVRSFSLITLLGSVTGALWAGFMGMALVVAISFFILLIVYYIVNVYFTRDIGLTTEIAVVYAFTVGFALTSGFITVQLSIALAVVLLLILSRKKYIKQLVVGVQRHEINAFISYAILALVILPFLPDTSVTVGSIPMISTFLKSVGIDGSAFKQVELINPFNIWVVVALITGIDVAAYVLEKTIGQRGWLVASFIGGLISSTATTQSIAQESKKNSRAGQLTASAVFSNLASFIPLIILIASLNPVFFITTVPYFFAISAVSIIIGMYYFRKRDHATDTNNDFSVQDTVEIFSLGPALKFAAVFLIIKLVTKLSLIVFGSSGLYVTAAIAALTGMDAITITIAGLVGESISPQIGLQVFVFANSINLSAKGVYAYLQGSRAFARAFANEVLIVILAGMALLLV